MVPCSRIAARRLNGLDWIVFAQVIVANAARVVRGMDDGGPLNAKVLVTKRRINADEF